MSAVMGETRRHCQTCDGTGGVMLSDVCGDPDCCAPVGDCSECGGNGYVTVVAAVDDFDDHGRLRSWSPTKAGE